MSNKTQLQTNNAKLNDIIVLVDEAKDIAASLPEAGSGSEDLDIELTAQEDLISQLSTILDSKASGSGTDFETSVVTLTVPVRCQYLGINFQPKDETTSTFETVKNSIVFISSTVVGGSGYTLLPSQMGATVLRLTEAIVNITAATSSGAD